jgi:phospholipid/cholesterol/gamma-HCH transport system permease protein
MHLLLFRLLVPCCNTVRLLVLAWHCDGTPRIPFADCALLVTDRLLAPLHAIGTYFILMGRAFASVREVRTYWSNFITQMVRIGVESIPIVALAAAFTGAVLTVQTAYQLQTSFVPNTIIGSIVVPSMMLELAAVITAFILAGRVGARIAAELGTMRVSEQIDALEVMGLNSISFLILPRVLAGVVMFPALYIFACLIGIGGGLGIAEAAGLLSTTEFIEGARQFYQPFDPYFGLIKSITFGFIITSIACYKGYYTKGGAEGVGQSTTEAAVQSCVFVLLADLALAVLLL